MLWRSGLFGGSQSVGEGAVASASSSSAPASSAPASPSGDASPSASSSAPASTPSLATTGVSLTDSAVASAPVTSPDAFDGSGNTTTYGASNLIDGDPDMQSIDVGPVEEQRITVRIDAVTRPGDAAFDQTAVSEVEILG